VILALRALALRIEAVTAERQNTFDVRAARHRLSAEIGTAMILRLRAAASLRRRGTA
jgi:hypothetical protein